MFNPRGNTGLILAIVIGVILISGIVYYLGTQRVVQTVPTVATKSQPTTSPTNVKTNWQTFTSPQYNPFYTDQKLQEEKARQKSRGNDPETDSSLQKIQFSLNLPSDWKSAYDPIGLTGKKDEYGSGYTFKKDNLEIRIARFYAPVGNSCNDQPTLKVITAKSLQFKRVNEFVNTDSIPKGYMRFALCAGDNSSSSSNSPIGVLSYTVPVTTISQDLDLMDQIITTLQIIKP